PKLDWPGDSGALHAAPISVQWPLWRGLRAAATTATLARQVSLTGSPLVCLPQPGIVPAALGCPMAVRGGSPATIRFSRVAPLRERTGPVRFRAEVVLFRSRLTLGEAYGVRAGTRRALRHRAGPQDRPG